LSRLDEMVTKKINMTLLKNISYLIKKENWD